MTKTPQQNEAPLYASLMGLGGLIPFFLCAGAAHSGVSPWNALAVVACGIYGSIILSFTGAVHWGLAMQGDRHPKWFIWSVMPAIYAWLPVVVFEPGLTLLALVPGFFLSWLVDCRAAQDGLLPAWYMRLRHVLTLGATMALAAGSLALPGGAYH